MDNIFIVIFFSFLIILFLLLLIKILKEGFTKKSSKHHSKKEILNSKIDTIYNQLDAVSNYHRVKKISSEMLIFMNEYTINLIMTKNYDGNIVVDKNNNWILKEGNVDKRIPNIYEEFKDNELNLKLLSYDINRYLVIGEFCILKEINPKIELIRMNNLFYTVNKIEIAKKYTVEQINEYIDNM